MRRALRRSQTIDNWMRERELSDHATSGRAAKRGLLNGCDVGEDPLFLKEGLRGAVGAEHELELAMWVCGDPVGVFAGGSLRAEVEIDGAVVVLLQLGDL